MGEGVRVEGGGCEGGRWRVEGGGCEGGRWRVEGGGWEAIDFSFQF
jgi:hypothetical protein